MENGSKQCTSLSHKILMIMNIEGPKYAKTHY